MKNPWDELVDDASGERLPRTVPQAWAAWAVAVMLAIVVLVFLDLALRGVL